MPLMCSGKAFMHSFLYLPSTSSQTLASYYFADLLTEMKFGQLKRKYLIGCFMVYNIP